MEEFDQVHDIRYADAFSAICRFEAFAVVGHAQTNMFVPAGQLYMGGGGEGMPEDIGDLFLHDTIDIQLEVYIHYLGGHAIIERRLYDGMLIQVIDQRLDQLPEIKSALRRDLVSRKHT